MSLDSNFLPMFVQQTTPTRHSVWMIDEYGPNDKRIGWAEWNEFMVLEEFGRWWLPEARWKWITFHTAYGQNADPWILTFDAASHGKFNKKDPNAFHLFHQ